jgi:hypothetical protein
LFGAPPGINCETCHGPGEAHARLFEKQPDRKHEDIKIIRPGKRFSAEQNNAACSSCHAKMTPLTRSFTPGARFFDHFDLATLEDRDFYPDGRDLGENYTYTRWRMSPCARAGKLDCLHCHTSSGRFRFSDDPNQSCAACHPNKVAAPTAHSRHPARHKEVTCVACHMPMTEFARMRRSDHSMLPPAPRATLVFKSPNACNLCHKDRDARWADQVVRRWRKRDYQAPLIHRASLVAAARQKDWTQLDRITRYIERADGDEITRVSLVRLLLSELKRFGQARTHPLRAAAADPGSAIAAYNLCVLTARASASRPGHPGCNFGPPDRRPRSPCWPESRARQRCARNPRPRMRRRERD